MGIITLAFDEGRKSQYQYAFPLLKKSGLKGSLFLITNFIGKIWCEQTTQTKIMDITQIRQLLQAKWEIASHTHTHCNLIFASKRQLIKEFQTSKDILKR